MSFDFKKIQHLSFQKKSNALNEKTIKELKSYLENFKVPFDKKAKKTELVRLALRKT
jgi:PAB1-binding protein PBP1